jgi:hypothetical protein
MLDPLPVAVAAIQGAILLVLAEGVRRGNVAAAVNALVAFAVAVLPFALGVTTDLVVAPGLALWLAVAGLLHAIGMLGPYDTISWWDTVTHFVSASFVAALCYAGVLVAAPSGWGTAAATTILLTFALGLWWELVELVARELGEEFDVEPVLVHYGPRDTLLDLVADVLGAVAVVAVDVRAFVPVVDPLLGPDRPFLRWAIIALAVGFAALTLLLVGLRRRTRGDR